MTMVRVVQGGRSGRAGAAVAGSNLVHVHGHNRRVILDVVRRVGASTRAEIARATRLTGQTVSNIVAHLEQDGLLVAGSPNRGGRGQPSIPYAINPRGAWSLGFHVDHRTLTGAIADFSGALVASASVGANQTSPDRLVGLLPQLARRLMVEAKADRALVLGAGLALPVRFGAGTISTAGPTTLPGWDDPDAAEKIERALGMQVFIENDAMAAAIGERLSGVARGIDSFVFLFVDDGLGAGLFLGGQPWRGAARNAGEIGHMIVEPEGRPCPCGNRGCLERYVSLSTVYETFALHPAQASPERVARRCREEPAALDGWVAEAAPRLARAIGILESTLDPDTVILGGVAPRILLERLVAAADPLPVSVGSRPGRPLPRVVLGSGSQQAIVLGAASLPIFDEVNPRFESLLKHI